MKGKNNMRTEEQKNAEIRKFYELFEEYRSAYLNEWERLEKCERMYHGDHWYGIAESDTGEPRPTTPIIQSTIENVRADLVDQFPEAVIVSDDPDKQDIADKLDAIISENHRVNNYQGEYLNLTHDLLVGGYMVQETGYDITLNAGLGGAFIRHVDIRNIMFDPYCTDVQMSRAIFKFTSHKRDWFKAHYGDIADEMVSDSYSINRVHDEVLVTNDTDTILLIECWFREFDIEKQQYSVHMVKLAGHQMLEDSRDIKPDGYFAHGKYPFIVTTLYRRKGSALGYGFVDMFEMQQRYSDKLDQIVLKNAFLASHNKLLITGASGFEADDLRDWSKDVHKGENLNGVTWFPTAPLPNYIIDYARAMRESIKEESGSNDFSRGRTNNGVTAASAIVALQEASGKRARMILRAIHSAFSEAVRQEIEIEREFSLFPRYVTMTDGDYKHRELFDGSMLEYKTELGNVLPLEFVVSVKVQKESRFSIEANNELVFRLVQAGMVTPDVGLELLNFDNKAQAVALMRKNMEKGQDISSEKETEIV